MDRLTAAEVFACIAEKGSMTAAAEALDMSRAVILKKEIKLPRREPIVEQFAKHMAADAKVLDEDAETGAKKFRYVRVGEDHFSLAFTYAMMAVNDRFWRSLPFSILEW